MVDDAKKPSSLLDESISDKNSSLDKLKQLHAVATEQASTKLAIARKVAGYASESSTDNQKNLAVFFKSISPKTYKFIIGGVITFFVIWQVTSIILNNLRPNWILADYEKAIAEGDLKSGLTSLEEYLVYKPDDWDRMREAAELSLVLGDHTRARPLLTSILSNPAQSTDVEILFLSALAHLPNMVSAIQKIEETIVSLDSYVPALIFRAVINATQSPEKSKADFAAALDEISRMSPDQEKYQRFQTLVNLFTIRMCRVASETFDGTIGPSFDKFSTASVLPQDLLIYGMDPKLDTNFCSLVPIDDDWQKTFNPNLLSLVSFYRAHIALNRGDLAIAHTAIGESYASEPLSLTSFLDGVLLALGGEFNAAVTAIQRTGSLNDATTLANLGVVYMLLAPDIGWSNASETWDKVLTLNPNHIRSLNNRAVMALMDERLGQARIDLVMALEQDPEYLYASFNLALVDYLEGNFEDAAAILANLNSSDVNLPGLHYFYGKTYNARGDTEHSLSEFRQSLNDHAYSTLGNIALGDFYYKQPVTHAKAHEHYQLAYDLNPDNFEAALKLANIKATLGDIDGALAFIEQNVNNKFTNLTGKTQQKFNELNLTTRARVLYVSEAEEAETVLRQAVAEVTNPQLRIASALLFTKLLLKKGDDASVREALDLTRTILPLESENINLLILRAQTLMQASDLDQAMSIIETALSKEPTNPSVLITRGDILALDQRWSLAVESYTDAFENNPRDLTPIIKAIELLESFDADSPKLLALHATRDALQDPEFLTKLAKTVTTTATSNKILASRRIISPEEIAKVKEKISTWEKQLEANEIKPFAAYINIGAMYNLINDPSTAIEYMKKAIALTDIPEAEAYQPWLNLSQLYTALLEYEAAEEAISTAIDLNPPDIFQLLYQRAVIREKLDPLTAIKDYDLIIEQKPFSYDAYYRRALNYLKIENGQQAIKDLNQAIKLKPNSIEAYRARRSAYGVIGDRQNAALDTETINILISAAEVTNTDG